MNPNSSHQLWSKWVWQVTPGRHATRWTQADVQGNCARFGRHAFGTAAAMCVRELAVGLPPKQVWEVTVLAEGVPAHDPQYVAWMQKQWRRFFVSGFGRSSVITAEAHVVAGDPQDGRPPEQLIIVPSIPAGVDLN